MNWKDQIQAFCVKFILVKYSETSQGSWLGLGKLLSTFKAEFLSVVADCDHGDQDEEDDQEAQSHSDDAGHGEALCNR